MSQRARPMVVDDKMEKKGLLATAPQDRKVDKDKVSVLPYRGYNPVTQTKVGNLPIHFWFYVYVYSSETDRVLAPLLHQSTRFTGDRRLMSIMNKAGVQIRLGDMEFYKSLPRRIIIMQGGSWDAIVRAIFEMEDMFPDLMRFASYPILMDNFTLQFNCTNVRQTKGVVRLT